MKICKFRGNNVFLGLIIQSVTIGYLLFDILTKWSIFGLFVNLTLNDISYSLFMDWLLLANITNQTTRWIDLNIDEAVSEIFW